MPNTMLGGVRFTTEMEREYRERATEAVAFLLNRKTWPRDISRPVLPPQESGNVFPSISGGVVEGAFVELTLWVPAPRKVRIEK